MKKLFSTIFLCVLCIAFTGCNNKDAQKVKELQARLDSIERADSLQKAEEVRIQNAKAEWDEFTSPDLKTFFLKGHVREMKEGDEVTRFSEDGKMTYHMGDWDSQFKHEIKRNEKGQITQLLIKDSWDGGDEGEIYRYGPDGYPNYYYIRSSCGIEHKYTRYNEHHWPISGEYGGCDGGARMVISYPSIDAHGNWTTKKETIKYSQVYEGDDDQVQTTKRTIKYYDFHE